MKIKIEKGIPINRQESLKSKTSVYRKAFAGMEVGDSFLIKIANSVDKIKERSLLTRAALHTGVKVITRTDEDGNLRVWKTD
jgi:hypothetical protein